MSFSAECILGEFVEAAQLAPARFVAEASATFDAMVEQQRRINNARYLRNYHRLHARPEWRKARAAKMRAYRERKRTTAQVMS